MALQFDNFYINPDRDKAIIQCHCSVGWYHGQIEIQIMPEWEDDPWVGYVNVHFQPADSLWRRMKCAWGCLFGKHIEAPLTLSAPEATLFAEWLIEQTGKVWDMKLGKPIPKETPKDA